MVSNGSAAVRSGQLLAVLFLLFSPLLAQAGDGGVLSGEATEDAGASESTQSGGNNRGCLSGRVTDALTGEALAGAVAVLDSGHQAAATGADGRFRFCGLSAEEEQVEVVKTGYRTARVGPMALGAQPWASLKIQLQSMVFQEWVEVEPAEPPPAAGLFPQGLNRGEASRVTGTLDDPLRALTILPGVSTVNGQKAELRLRAGEPEDTQFHLDGVTLENPYHFRGARGSTTALNLEAFDSLEVTTAGLGAEVGNTTAGAVTLSPTERGRSGRFRETAVGTLTSRFSSGGPLPQGGSWVTAARYSNLDLYRGFISSNLETSRFGDLYLRARQPLAPNLDLVAGGLGSASTAESLENRGLTTTHLSARSSLMYVGLDAAPRANLALTARLSFNDLHQTLTSKSPDPFTDQEKRTGLFLTAQASAGPLPRWRAGLQAEQIQGDLQGTFDADLSLRPLSANTTRVGTFTSWFFHPTEYWTIEAGLRSDRDARQGSTGPLPRFRADFSPDGGWGLHLSGGRYAQFQPFQQEFLSLDDPLGPTFSDQLSAGARFSLRGGVQVQIDLFITQSQDLTAEVENILPDLAEIMGRFETGSTRGVELSIRRNRGRFQTQIALTGLSAQATRQGSAFRRNTDQPYQLDLLGLYLLSNRWEIAGRFQAAAGLPFTPLEPLPDGQLRPGRLNGSRLPPSAQLDIRATYTHRGAHMKTRYYLEILNVLNRENVTSRVLKKNGQTGSFQVDERTAFPRLPSFGIQMIW